LTLKHEVNTPPELFEKIISGLSDSAILVGGQALAFWVDEYDINWQETSLIGSISDDSDFLGSKADVRAIARATSGQLEMASPERITSLVGIVQIGVGNNEFVNVDVLHKLYNLDAEKVRARAPVVTIGNKTILVMHPLDVLKSRIENLSGLSSKQNIEGVDQASLAIKVARAYIIDLASDNASKALKATEEVVSIAKSGAGQRVASKFQLNFLLAIPADAIENEGFHQHRWPQIQQELSEDKALTAAKEFAEKHGYQLRHANQVDGHYIGNIVYTNAAIALQHVGRDIVISHAIGTWKDRPNHGGDFTIRYRHGEVDVQPKPLAKDRNLSR